MYTNKTVTANVTTQNEESLLDQNFGENYDRDDAFVKMESDQTLCCCGQIRFYNGIVFIVLVSLLEGFIVALNMLIDKGSALYGKSEGLLQDNPN